MHCGYVVKIEEIRPHPNADRLDILTIFNRDTIVARGAAQVGDIGVYFPSDNQLGEEFCEQNHLCRTKIDGSPDIGYLDMSKRNVKTIKLRGEYSDGIYLPLSCLEYTGYNLQSLSIGDTITELNGHDICHRWVPTPTKSSKVVRSPKVRKIKAKKWQEYPYFAEHIDTPYLDFCKGKFHPGDEIVITEKVHGTSARYANQLANVKKPNFFQKLFHIKPKMEPQFIIGSRRTVVTGNPTGDYYGTNQFRVDWGEKLKGKIPLGFEVFGEIAGFYEPNRPIMATVDNHKIKDEAFIQRYGERTVFTYGCDPTGKKAPLNRFFIYRLTLTTLDGAVKDFKVRGIQKFAAMAGMKTVPVLETFTYTTHEDLEERVQKWLDIPSFIDPRHIIEGVVVRADNQDGYVVAKAKSKDFQILEGIIKEEAEEPDMEESEE